MRNWLRNWRLYSLFTVLALVLTGCDIGKPYLSMFNPIGEAADKQYFLLKLSTGIMIFVVSVVVIIFLIVFLRFRERKGQENSIPKQVEGSNLLEIIWTVIPVALLLILAVPTVKITFELGDVSPMKVDTRDKSALVVNVRSSLYWWEFEYPDYGVVTAQDLVVPTDEKVYFELHASDVKHAFWVPAAGGKIDTNTDNKTQFWLEFDAKRSEEAGGLLYGKCTELCGPSHALMDFKVKTVSRADFDVWIDKMKNAKKVEPTDAVAKEGEAIFNKSCVSCHAVTPSNATPAVARLAPNLSTFAQRSRVAGVLEFANDQEHMDQIKLWLKDPEAQKPGNKMTGTYKVDEKQIDALAAYLMTLKVE